MKQLANPVQSKVVIVTQHYPPDPSTTANIMEEIACRLARKHNVVVLSGTAGVVSPSDSSEGKPVVTYVKRRMTRKGALFDRTLAETSFVVRMFVWVLKSVRPGDVILTVTAPFTLPYAVAAASRLKGARTVVIMHDLYPDVLISAGFLSDRSFGAWAIRLANSFMFDSVSRVVTIGRDVAPRLLTYPAMELAKIQFIPNWATLCIGERPLAASNSFRQLTGPHFLVGLSGNLGFTHDPEIVFEAAQMLADEPSIHFLLSGWGVGFDRLLSLLANAKLPNVTVVSRVEDERLEEFLTAADVWIIPYRERVAGVSVPSRFYNLLAVGRPVVLISEPDSEAALTIIEHEIGWVVMPGRPKDLADTLLAASRSNNSAKRNRAAQIATRFTRQTALEAYSGLIEELLVGNVKG